MITVACTSTTGPDNDVDSPKDKRISLQYIRQPPINYSYGNVAILRWNYPGLGRVLALMMKIEG